MNHVQDRPQVHRGVSHGSFIPEPIRTAEEILLEAQQEKIREFFVQEFGEVKGNRKYQVYLGNEPPSLRWEHYRPKPKIPEEFRKEQVNFSKPLVNPSKKRKYLLPITDVKQTKDGFAFDYHIKPLTIDDHLDQYWITKHRANLMQKDEVLLTKKYALELHLAKKPIKKIKNISGNLFKEKISAFFEKLSFLIERVCDVFKKMFLFFSSIFLLFNFTLENKSEVEDEELEIDPSLMEFIDANQ